MFSIKKLISLFLILTSFLLISGCSNTASTSATEKTEDLSGYFSSYNGCFLLFDTSKNEYTIYNEAQSKKQLSPCSTFKIINTLIGLETKVLTDENTALKWDKTNYPIKSWNKDQTLKTAFQNSVVWYFQKVATGIGQDKMQSYLDEINFGNKDISGGIKDFWLQSSLTISPRQWLEVLKKIYTNNIPISKNNIDILKKVLILSDENGAVLSGKTGSGLQKGTADNYINGWFVGYVEKGGNVYYFVTNMQANKNATGTKAKEITMNILKDKQIY